jgi:hypothetical protein
MFVSPLRTIIASSYCVIVVYLLRNISSHRGFPLFETPSCWSLRDIALSLCIKGKQEGDSRSLPQTNQTRALFPGRDENRLLINLEYKLVSLQPRLKIECHRGKSRKLGLVPAEYSEVGPCSRRVRIRNRGGSFERLQSGLTGQCVVSREYLSEVGPCSHRVLGSWALFPPS